MDTPYLIGYKIVRQEEGKLLSLYILGKGVVEYKLNIWTYPKLDCGGLAVYADLDVTIDMFQFMNTYKMGNIKLYKCLYIPSSDDMFYIGENKITFCRLSSCFKSTDIAQCVMLKEEITIENKLERD